MQPDAAERIEWDRPRELPGTDILLVERSARRWVVFHEKYVICTGLDSCGAQIGWRYRGRTHHAGGRVLMLFEPGEVHANTAITPPVSFRALHIEPSSLLRWADEMGAAHSNAHWSCAYSHNGVVHRAFARLHASLETAAPALERESRFAVCMRLLLERCTDLRMPAAGHAPRASLGRVCDFIREHHAHRITLRQLAEASGISRFHLIHAFARQFGAPPHAYQIQVQVAKAGRLLASGMAPAQVAAEVGFADQSHLARHFKSAFGITPGKYRGAARGRS